jgi:hypothetical protein
MVGSLNDWRAFEEQCGECVKNMEKNYQALPRYKRMALHRAMRKGYKEAMKIAGVKEPLPGLPAPTNQQKKRKEPSTGWASSLWKPRK